MRTNKARAVAQQDIHINDMKHQCYCKMALNYKRFTDGEWAELIAYINEGDIKGFRKAFKIWEAQHGNTKS